MESTPSFGRFGSKHFDELEAEENVRSGLESLCTSPASTSTSSCLNIEESSPSVSWKLPGVNASNVYKHVSPFHLKALS